MIYSLYAFGGVCSKVMGIVSKTASEAKTASLAFFSVLYRK